MWVMLSPQEREPAMVVLGKSLNGEHSPALENLLPLPGGEGRGEGEREFQLNRYGFPVGVGRCARRDTCCFPGSPSSFKC